VLCRNCAASSDADWATGERDAPPGLNPPVGVVRGVGGQRKRAVVDVVFDRALFEQAKGLSHEVTRTTLYRGEKHAITNTVSHLPDTQACMFWLRNRQPEYWQVKPEAPLAAVDNMAARLDAAGESMRHAAEQCP
jgi:hypothetical protein